MKNELSFTGSVSAILDLEEGIANSGNAWKSQLVRVVESGTHDYPQDVVFKFFGKKVDLVEELEVGDEVEIGFNLKSRSWVSKDGTERWSTEANAWRVKQV